MISEFIGIQLKYFMFKRIRQQYPVLYGTFLFYPLSSESKLQITAEKLFLVFMSVQAVWLLSKVVYLSPSYMTVSGNAPTARCSDG